MYSKVYGSVIKFCQNQQDRFITDSLNSNLFQSNKPLSSGHPLLPKYSKAISKLFSQININQSNLWVIPTIGTSSVRVYFSDPLIYPVSSCCQKSVYVDMDEAFNGSIICPSCNMILVSFIYYQDMENKQGKISEVYKHTLFKQRRKENNIKNRIMYENLVSNRFKTKNLKRIFQNNLKQSKVNKKLASISQFQKLQRNGQLDQNRFQHNNNQSSKNNELNDYQSSKNNELNNNQSSKQGFILQIRASMIKQKNSSYNKSLYKGDYRQNNEQGSKQDEKSKDSEHFRSIQQTRNIIIDIFR